MKRNRTQQKTRRPQAEKHWTMREYIEFSSAREFQKFNVMPRITHDEIASVDWSLLSDNLLKSA